MSTKVNRPVCIYYDYGHTAPIDFGAYCTLTYKPTKLEDDKCQQCISYIPKITNFLDWFSLHEERLNQCSLQNALQLAWTQSAKLARKF